MNPDRLFTAPIAFGIGAQKCGTTSLHSLLLATGRATAPYKKETKFFARDDLFTQGFGSYAEMFGGGSPELLFEVDPEYMLFGEAVAPRIKAFRPDAKFVVLLRDPVKRAYSHYCMSVGRGLETRTFGDAVLGEPRAGSFFERDNFSYFERGLYHQQLEPFLSLFRRDQILVLRFDDIVRQPIESASELSEFLGWGSDGIPVAWPHENAAFGSRSRLFARILHSEVLFELSKLTFSRSDSLMRQARRVNRALRALNHRGHGAGTGLAEHDDVTHELRQRYSPSLRRLSAELGVRVDEWLGDGMCARVENPQSAAPPTDRMGWQRQ